MANRVNDYLAELRNLEGLKNVILRGITISKRENTAEFFLITDKTYTEREELEAQTISARYLPAGMAAKVRIVKRVPEAESLKMRIYEYIQKNFPAAGAFLEEKDDSA